MSAQKNDLKNRIATHTGSFFLKSSMPAFLQGVGILDYYTKNNLSLAKSLSEINIWIFSRKDSIITLTIASQAYPNTKSTQPELSLFSSCYILCRK